MEKKLVIIYPDCKFDFRAMNSRGSLVEILLAPALLSKIRGEDFVVDLEYIIAHENISSISIELSTESKEKGVISEQEACEMLIGEMEVVTQIPTVSDKIKKQELTVRAFVYNSKNGQYKEMSYDQDKVCLS